MTTFCMDATQMALHGRERRMGTDSGAPKTDLDEKARTAAPMGVAALVVLASVVSLTLTQTHPNTAPSGTEDVSSTSGGAPIPGLPTIAENQAGVGGGVQLGVEIVVKFKDDAAVKDICDLFWRDPVAARAKFREAQPEWPAFEGLVLDRVTYSNELVLVSAGAADADTMRKAARAIQAMPAIAYAEPNTTAQPGDRQ